MKNVIVILALKHMRKTMVYAIVVKRRKGQSDNGKTKTSMGEKLFRSG